MASQAALDLIIGLKDNASGPLGKITGALGGLAKIGGAAFLGGAVAGVAGLSAALVGGIQDARAANIILAQTEAVIKSTGGAAGVTAGHVADLAASLSAASGKSLFGDDQIQESTNLLLTFTNLKGGVLDAATAMSVDLAQAMGGAPADAAVQLGKALNDPIGGISALTRVGVTFTDQQKAQIKTMVEAGDVAGAQGIILAELNKEFGGSAAAAAAADGGMAQFRDRMGELAESIGARVLPMLNQLLAWLNSPEIQAGITAIVDGMFAAGAAFGSFVQYIAAVVQDGDVLNDFIMGLPEPLRGIVTVIGEVVAALMTGLGAAFTWLSNTAIPALIAGWRTIQPVLATIGEIITGTVVPAFQQLALFVLQNSEILTQIGVAVGIVVAVFTTLSTVVAVVGTVTTAIAGMGTAVTVAGGTIAAIVAVLGGPLTIAIGAVAIAAGLLYAAWTTNFGGIQEKTAAVWAFLQESTQTVITALSRFWTEVVPQLSEAWTTIQTTAQTAWTAVHDVIVAVVGPIVAELSRFWTEIQPQVIAAWDNIQSVTQTVWSAVQDVITTVAGAIARVVSVAWTAIQSVVTTVGGAILGFIQSHMTQIQAIFSGVWTVIQGIITVAWSIVSGIITTGLAVLAGDWSGAWEAIKATFSGVWDGIKLILSGALTVIQAELSIAWAAITSVATAAWEALRSGVETKIAAVVTLAQGIPGKVISALSGLAGELLALGAAAIQGLINGLKSIDIGSVLGGILRGGIAAAKAAIGSKSPSKLTRDVLGKPMGEGIVLGIRTQGSAVADALSDITAGVVPSAGTLGDEIGAALVGGFADTKPMDQIANKLKTMLNQTIPAGTLPFAGTLGGNLGQRTASMMTTGLVQGLAAGQGQLTNAMGQTMDVAFATAQGVAQTEGDRLVGIYAGVVTRWNALTDAVRVPDFKTGPGSKGGGTVAPGPPGAPIDFSAASRAVPQRALFGPTIAPSYAALSSRPATVTNDNRVTFEAGAIVQQPGQDTRQFVALLADEMDRRNRLMRTR